MTASAAARLAEERAQTEGLLRSLNRDLAAVFAATEGANTDDEHDPEGSTIAFERSQLRLVIDDASGRLDEIDAALARLTAGSYGICAGCGALISPHRLEARPTSVHCLACAARSGQPG